ncbi:MAG: hypothetical protein ACP6IY_22570 [Promethearchaeia archaeon]
MTENKKISKMFEKIMELYYLSERDEMIYGDSFIEFTERSIRILDPTKVKIKHLKKDTLRTSRKTDKQKPCGKSILKSKFSKTKE